MPYSDVGASGQVPPILHFLSSRAQKNAYLCRAISRKRNEISTFQVDILKDQTIL